MIQNKTILLISPEAWGTNFVSKHHYANYLAKHNTVYFLNPPTSFTKNPFGSVSTKTRVIKHGLIVVNYMNLLPRLNALPSWLRKKTYARQAKQIQAKLGIDHVDIVWSFDPNRFSDQHAWNANKRIYHTVDVHSERSFEEEIILSSDHFFGVAPLILKNLESIRKGVLIPHAADLEGFVVENVSLPGQNKLKAIYTGNFHRHINYNLLKMLVEQNPTVDFVMIGPTSASNLSKRHHIAENELNQLSSFENLFFIGAIPPHLLMSYLLECSINLVLFNKENESIHCSPHKLMAYFYSGNITLSNYIDAHKETNADIMLMCNSDLEILTTFELIKSNLEHYNSPELRAKRRNFAEQNSYDLKIQEISKLLYD